MRTLQEAVTIANEWTPGCNRWEVFENMPSAPDHLRWAWHGCKLLAIAQENGDVAKIERERASLTWALESYMESMRGAEPGYQDGSQAGPSLGAQIALGVVAGAGVAALARSGLGHGIARQALRQAAFGATRSTFANLFRS
jgi:hypothetical protein